MKFSARLIVLFLFLFSCFFSLTSQASAQTATPTASTTNINSTVPNNLHNWTQNVMVEVMLALTCQLVGIDPTTPDKQCLGMDQETGKIGFLPAGNAEKGEIGGAIGGMTNMISFLYTPPIHTSDYFQNLAQNFGVTKKTYAQEVGTGFDGLKPLLSLWTVFRNIVYLVFVIVFIIIGMAVMLRVKIDPRTVMTIQNQIPKIIVGILLVTFSFAIAGFLIDLMWVFIHLIFGLISGVSQDVAKNVENLNPIALQGKSPLGMGFVDLGGLAGKVALPAVGIVQNLFGINPKPTDLILGGGALVDFMGFVTNFFPGKSPISAGSPFNFLIDLVSGLGSLWGGFQVLKLPEIKATILGFGGSPGFLANLPFAIPFATLIHPFIQEFLRVALPFLIIYIIIFMSLLIALFRLWFVLLMAYVYILIDVVLAPFWIMGSLIPGSPISVSGWLRNLISNLAAFPATLGMLLLGKVFMDAFKTSQNPFTPPLIGDLGDPSMLSSLIGIGIIMMTPNVVNMLKAALKAPKVDTGGAMKGLGAGAGVLTGTTKSGAGATSAYLIGDPLSGKKGSEGLRHALSRKIFG